MRERTGFPSGVPCWIDTAQPDPQAAVEFYSGLFGWEFEDQMPADAPGHYFVARLGGRDVA
ncbi:MAG: VOC family protein, partial [Micromonosporaceae bacterium]